MKSFGLALGGGGVKGLGHIPLLKKLDALGCKPTRIAGTSMGAIIGGLYASGLSGEEIDSRVREHLFSRKNPIKHAYQQREKLVKWLKVFAYEKSRGGLLTAEGLFQHLFSELVDIDFSDLPIPFTAVAADFHTGEEVVLKTGPLLRSIQASMAVPGVFAPVTINEQLLIDGGVINNVPCVHAKDDCDIIVASDVISLCSEQTPKVSQVLSGSLSIMLKAATRANLAHTPPDFIFQVDTDNIDAFDFHKIKEVLARGEEALEKNEAKIEALLCD